MEAEQARAQLRQSSTYIMPSVPAPAKPTSTVYVYVYTFRYMYLIFHPRCRPLVNMARPRIALYY